MSRRSRAVLLVWIVVVGSSAEGVAAGQVRSADHAASEGVCAFSGTQMWGSDYGHSLERMGLSYPALYVARGSPVRLRRLPILGDAGAMWAAACPQGDLVAYVSSPIGKSEPQVVIADTSGRVLASFPGAVRCGWSWDGHRLAAEFGRLDVRTDPVFENKGESDSVMVWERATGSRRVFAVRPMAMEWGRGDTLFLAYAGHVDALSVTSGSVSAAAYRYGVVSPDGEYSLVRDEVRLGGFRCEEELTDVDVSGCLLDALGFGDEPFLAGPFWLGGAKGDHLLCVSGCESYSVARGQRNCRSAIIDPRTLDVVQTFAGWVVAATNDWRGLVVVSGDSLGMVVVTTTHSKPREGASVRLELELEEWGGKPTQVPGAATRPRRVWYWQCREGDWLPSRMNLDRCDKFFRVARVVNPDSVYVEFPGKYFVGGVSNGFITRSPRTWRTASFDGGYDLTLSVVR